MGHTSPLQELFEYPARMPETLERFNLTVAEYAMLHACGRDAMHFGIDPRDPGLSNNRRRAIRALCDRGLIVLNMETEKWETTSAGKTLWLVTHLHIHQDPVSKNRTADILPFRSRGNSA